MEPKIGLKRRNQLKEMAGRKTVKGKEKKLGRGKS